MEETAVSQVAAQRSPPEDRPPLGSGSSQTVSGSELQNFAQTHGTPGQEPQAGLQSNQALCEALKTALEMAGAGQLANLISQPGGSEGPVCIGGETSIQMTPSSDGKGSDMRFTDLPGGNTSSRKSSAKPGASKEDEEDKENPAEDHPIQDAADELNQFLDKAKEFAIRIALDSLMPGAGQAYQAMKQKQDSKDSQGSLMPDSQALQDSKGSSMALAAG